MSEIGKLFNFPDIYSSLFNLNFSLMNSQSGLKLFLNCHDILNEHKKNNQKFIDIKIEHDLFQSVVILDTYKDPEYLRFLNPKIIFFKGKGIIKLVNTLMNESVSFDINMDSLINTSQEFIIHNYKINDEESNIIGRMYKNQKILVEIKISEYNKDNMNTFINHVGINHNKQFLQKRFKIEKDVIKNETTFLETGRTPLFNFFHGIKNEEIVYFKKLKMIKSDLKNEKGMFLQLNQITDISQKEVIKNQILDNLTIDDFLNYNDEDLLTMLDDTEIELLKVYRKVYSLITEWNI